jgi:hypothetical protein
VLDTRDLKPPDANKEQKMAQMEKIELEWYRQQLTDDVKGLLDRYRSIFEWDLPEIDEAAADKLILAAIRQALDGLEPALSGASKA